MGLRIPCLDVFLPRNHLPRFQYRDVNKPTQLGGTGLSSRISEMLRQEDRMFKDSLDNLVIFYFVSKSNKGCGGEA